MHRCKVLWGSFLLGQNEYVCDYKVHYRLCKCVDENFKDVHVMCIQQRQNASSHHTTDFLPAEVEGGEGWVPFIGSRVTLKQILSPLISLGKNNHCHIVKMIENVS